MLYIQSRIFLEKELNKKIPLAILFILVCLFFILFRLWYMQVLRGNLYSELSTNNRIRVTKIPAPRGYVFARDGEVLVDNVPSFDLTIIPQDIPDDPEDVLEKISILLNEDITVFKKKLNQSKGRPPFEPVVLKQDLSWRQMSLIETRKIDLDGVTIEVVPRRTYSLGSATSHLLGYLGEIDRNELKKEIYSDYTRGDLLGKCGIEKWGERYLHGNTGGYQTEVDALGHKRTILAEIAPLAGGDLHLAISLKAQRAAEQMLKGKQGAAVALDPNTGDVLVMASSPGFDPNLFSRGIDAASWQGLIKNPQIPLLNRALQSQQPPGSVFKIFVAIAALEEGLVDPEKTIFCPGSFTYGTHTFRCWRKEGHGVVNLRRAIVESCDVYFYQLGNAIGIQNIAKYAKMLGLGEKTNIDLEDEKGGLVPTPEWKKDHLGTKWQGGETINTAIGQGYVLTTPIQLAAAFCGIANGRFIPKPRIVIKINTGESTLSFPVSKRKEFSLSEKTLSFIRDALWRAVNDPRGTGSKAKLEEVPVGGKTGTAQVVVKGSGTSGKLPADLEDHAWFVSFAPVDNPKIVVAVLVEHGGHGGSAAAPLAKEIMRAYLNIN